MENPVSLTEINISVSPLESLEECKKAINEGMDNIAAGVFYTAFAVKSALDILRKEHNADEEYNKARDTFFEGTHLVSSPSDKSKLLTIAKNVDDLYKYKDHIPGNMTALYLLASREKIAERLPKITDEKRGANRLRSDLTIKELTNLLERDDIKRDKIKSDTLPSYLNIRLPDLKAHAQKLQANNDVIQQKIQMIIEEYTDAEFAKKVTFDLATPIKDWTPPKPRKKKKASA